ncbi:hypothetical protein AVEN_115070-1 [Araneus ventricosus]|uniref:Uncharacterized protein n=1 Tax=Araneus ventricosus TaxID=182803 RepID=A0A4Y1ZY53_ARAVE|nr:hypothetical protein AVEN_115070-1 [Araneus ventricosus]
MNMRPHVLLLFHVSLVQILEQIHDTVVNPTMAPRRLRQPPLDSLGESVLADRDKTQNVTCEVVSQVHFPSHSITGERQLQFQQSRYHMGRSLTLPLCLLVLAGNNGVAFTPWVALPGEYTPDVHHPLLPGTYPCRVEATNRSKGETSCSYPI